MDGVGVLPQTVSSAAAFLTVMHFAVACTVTIHTLVFKRDVRAAIGWIGMAWLAPVFGALLYVGFGINRVKRKAQRLMGAERISDPKGRAAPLPDDPSGQLKSAVDTITGQPLRPVQSVEIFDSGDEAYPAMLDAIETATVSIALATYIFQTDNLGEVFIGALARAHRRGVSVRVLIDGFGGGFILSRAYHALLRQDVPVARFLHSTLPWKMPLLDLRLHKKALVIDHKVAFVGGLNIAQENLLKSNPGSPIRDTHFRVTGPVVSQIQDDFREDWSFATGSALERFDGAAVQATSTCGEGRAISSGPDQEVDHLVLVLLSAIASATRSIRIATPYFLPDEQLVTALQLAVYRGVAVDIVMPATNNHFLVAWACRPHIRPLVEAGCRVWHSPAPFDHSKMVAIDDRWSLIGSANWDARSLRLNFELTIELYDAAFSRRLAELIENRCVEPVTLQSIDQRWLPVKLRDAAARLMMPYL